MVVGLLVPPLYPIQCLLYQGGGGRGQTRGELPLLYLTLSLVSTGPQPGSTSPCDLYLVLYHFKCKFDG